MRFEAIRLNSTAQRLASSTRRVYTNQIHLVEGGWHALGGTCGELLVLR